MEKKFIPKGFSQNEAADDDQTDEQDNLNEDGLDLGPSPADIAALKLFLQAYIPASNFNDATVFLSTTEIKRMIHNHTGGFGMPVDHIHNWLNENGYKWHHLGELEVVWLLIER